MKKPKYHTGQEPLKVTAEMVFAAVKGIIETGQEEEFLRACKRRKAFVSVDPKHVNFVKKYLFEKRAHEASALAMRVVDSDRCTA